VIAVIAVIVLGVLFVWLSLPSPQTTRRLVTVSSWGTDRLAAAPIAFEAEDAELLKTLASFETSPDGAAAREGDLAGVRSRLAEISAGDDDVLLLYLSAHGYGEDGRAYLGAGDVAWERGSSIEVGELLDGVDASRAGLKLLVLDVGRVESDLRRGMLVNEFPRLVEQELRQREDRNLWVLLASGPLERSHVNHPLRQGVFARVLAEALSGKCDPWPMGDGNKTVSLDELYRYALWRCRLWFPQDVSQTPLLLKSGVGLVTLDEIPTDDSCRIVPVQDDWPPDANSADAKANVDAAGAAVPKAVGAPSAAGQPDGAAKADAAVGDSSKPGADGGAEKDTAEKDAASTGENPPNGEANGAGDGVPPSKPTAASVLHAAWLVRDRLESRDKALSEHSPVDFAPHLWQEISAWLVFYEQSLRAGKGGMSGGESDELMRAIQQRKADLTALHEAMAGHRPAMAGRRPATGATLPRRRQLLQAWENYSQSSAQFSPGQHPMNQAAEKARRQYHDAAQRAPWYVRWHRLAIMTGAANQATTGRIREFLEQLAAAENLLVQLQGERSEEELEPHLARFAELDRSRQAIDNVLTAEAHLVRMSIKEQAYQQRAEDLLATPLLGAVARRELIEALQSAPAPAAPDLPPAPEDIANVTKGVSLSVAPGKWQRFHDHAQLELSLIRWAQPETADRLKAVLLEATPISGSDDAVWSSFQRFGAGLGDFYRRLPGEQGSRDAFELAGSQRARAALCLIDPRDTPRVEALSLPPPPLLTIAVPAKVELNGPLEVVLPDERPVEFEIELRASQQRLLGSGLTWNIEFDRAMLDLQKMSETEVQRVADGRFSKRYVWQAVALPAAFASGAQTTRVAVTAHWDDGMDKADDVENFSVVLPRPNRIDLALARNGAPASAAEAGTLAGLPLDANRLSRFQLLLDNKSGRAQSVNAKLYAVPEVPGLIVPAGTIPPEVQSAVFDDSSGKFRILPRLLAETAGPIALEADSRLTPIVLAPPGASAPSPSTGTSDAGAGADAGPKPEPPPASFEPVDVGRGLVLVITEANSNAHWVKWIELSPRHPREFLEVDVGLDIVKNQLVALVRPRNRAAPGAGFSEDAAVLVEWDTFGEEVVEDGAKQLADVLTFKAGMVTPPELRLFATVPPDAEQWNVRLSINGYPRAFMFDVRRPGPGEKLDGPDWKLGVPAGRTARNVQITSVKMDGDPKLYHLEPYGTMPREMPPAPEGEPPPIEHVRHPEGAPIVFRDTGKPLTVTLAADAPSDALDGRDGDRLFVQLGTGEYATTVNLFSDRRFSPVLAAVSPEGELVFDAPVSDHSVTLKTLGLSNVFTRIKAQLEVPGETPPDLVRVQFDGDTPRLELPSAVSVDRGDPLRVPLTLEDQSGIERIRYVLLPPEATEMPAEGVADLTLRTGPGKQTTPLSFPTDELAAQDWKLFVEAIDLTGRRSETAVSRITVKEPLRYIKGEIRYQGNVRVNGLLFTLTVQGKGIDDIVIKNLPHDGSFKVGPLPAGMYTLSAVGSFANSTVKGKREEVEPAKLDEDKSVTLTVAKEEKEKEK
jgi:hypothetical protein